MFPNNNPYFFEKLAETKQEEIIREIEGAREPLFFRARSEMLIVVTLLVVLVWLFI